LQTDEELPVNEDDDDILHIHIWVKISAGAQEAAQSLQMKFIRENLKKKKRD
jgi:hypothetical protein